MEKIAGSACHCINLRRAANAVTAYYDRMLAQTGVTVNQYSILTNIRRIEPCSVAELARRVKLERTTLVRSLKPLYVSGLIRDEAGPGNRKSRIRLTEAGIDTIAAAKSCWMQAQTDIETRLGDDTLRTLTDALLLLEELCAQSSKNPLE